MYLPVQHYTKAFKDPETFAFRIPFPMSCRLFNIPIADADCIKKSAEVYAAYR